MSNAIVGECAVKPGAVKTKGSMGRLAWVPVNTPSKMGRDTKGKQVEKYLEDPDTGDYVFDHSLFRLPSVHMVRSTGETLRMDGDHTTALWKLTYPNKKKMPVWLTEVDSLDDYHRNFNRSNGSNRKNVNPDEQFVNRYQYKIEAKAQGVRLKQCGLNVYGSSEPGGVVGDLHGKQVSIKTFEAVEELVGDLHAIKSAVQTISDTWPGLKKLDKPLLGGFAAVFKENPNLFSGKGKIAKDWDIFTERLQEMTAREFREDVKTLTPVQQNKTIESFADGIVKMWVKKNYRSVGGCGRSYKQTQVKSPWL